MFIARRRPGLLHAFRRAMFLARHGRYLRTPLGVRCHYLYSIVELEHVILFKLDLELSQ